MNQVIFQDLGAIDYKQAWDYQESLFTSVVNAKVHNRYKDATPLPVKHYFLFCEHYPVITLGKNANTGNVLLSKEMLEKRNIALFPINRGGDVTFHGPGQIVGYPILDLDAFYTDIGRYLRDIEEVIIRTIAVYGVKGERMKGVTGVWLDANNPYQARKICAIGIRCSRWVTMHGFAFNVNTDLSFFETIVPCGLNDKKVTSLQVELNKELDMEEVKQLVKSNFENVFQCKLITE